MDASLSHQADSTRADLASIFFSPKDLLEVPVSTHVPMSINDWGIWLRTLTLSVDDDSQRSGDKPWELQRTPSAAHHTHSLFLPMTDFTSQLAL